MMLVAIATLSSLCSLLLGRQSRELECIMMTVCPSLIRIYLPFSELVYISLPCVIFMHCFPSYIISSFKAGTGFDDLDLDPALWLTHSRHPYSSIIPCWVNERVRSKWLLLVLLSYHENTMSVCTWVFVYVRSSLSHIHIHEIKNVLSVKYIGNNGDNRT